ncbi:MAG TPA: MlaD family protein [Chthoniobacterales bacterium]|jgi:phospholipid/cholesterol/gamma-HCH transport system substrate-binding protein
MNEADRGLELKVGIFLAVGLFILAALVVEFGRIGEGFKSYYSLTIHFADASGLLKGSDVLLGGAKIGQVSEQPRLTRNGQGVDVPLRIYDFARIRKGSSILIGSSGLLGDRFVQIEPPKTPTNTFLPDNAYVEGTREEGLSALTKQGGALLADLRNAVAKIDTVIDRLNSQALSQGNMDHLKTTFDNLNKTSATLADSSKKIDDVIAKADGALDSTKAAADKVQLAVADARKTIQSAGNAMNDATEGDGPLALLLTDKNAAGNLRALISNLRTHGILFYRDTAAKSAPPEPSPPLRRATR